MDEIATYETDFAGETAETIACTLLIGEGVGGLEVVAADEEAAVPAGWIGLQCDVACSWQDSWAIGPYLMPSRIRVLGAYDAEGREIALPASAQLDRDDVLVAAQNAIAEWMAEYGVEFGS